ncbi:MAG TPA: carbohydrate-binding family 9-like protein [Thermoanaerobaculia bacterium]|nr:carbohydrate-binding family 9-like protein [Thermoanaerobaculia bacterium]
MSDLPCWRVPHAAGLADPGFPPGSLAWDEIPGLPPFLLADGSGPASQQTRVRIAWDDEALHVRFDCEDRDAWGTFERRDDPIYEEEAVEIFLAAGTADPIDYFEFEVSPRGVLWDGVIHNPTSRREERTTDRSWDCPGIRWAAGKGGAQQDWWAAFAIPWKGISQGEPPRLWRANFYRIERPRDGEPEFSGWSSTFTHPADFHQPARFGVLELAGAGSNR